MRAGVGAAADVRRDRAGGVAAVGASFDGRARAAVHGSCGVRIGGTVRHRAGIAPNRVAGGGRVDLNGAVAGRIAIRAGDAGDRIFHGAVDRSGPVAPQPMETAKCSTGPGGGSRDYGAIRARTAALRRERAAAWVLQRTGAAGGRGSGSRSDGDHGFHAAIGRDARAAAVDHRNRKAGRRGRREPAEW